MARAVWKRHSGKKKMASEAMWGWSAKFSRGWQPVTVEWAGIKRGYKLLDTTLHRNDGVFPQTTTSDFVVCCWEVCLEKYGTPATRTILLKMLPIEALQGVINRHKIDVCHISLVPSEIILHVNRVSVSWSVSPDTFQWNGRLQSKPESFWILLPLTMRYPLF